MTKERITLKQYNEMYHLTDLVDKNPGLGATMHVLYMKGYKRTWNSLLKRRFVHIDDGVLRPTDLGRKAMEDYDSSRKLVSTWFPCKSCGDEICVDSDPKDFEYEARQRNEKGWYLTPCEYPYDGNAYYYCPNCCTPDINNLEYYV